ncbi:MAG: hypothetical protein FWG16_00665 [Micrococcales bacterium]|nr:hypothetical protein [Micrococcales bacterium]
MAREATHEELVQIGDGLMRFRDPITDPATISQFLDGQSNHLPTIKARAALADMRQGTDSIRETEMRGWIVNAGLPVPQVNPTLVDSTGQFLARVDCLFEQWMTVAEYDGMVHDATHNRTRDNIRRQVLRNHHYEVVVATKADLADPSRFVHSLALALVRQAKRLHVSAPVGATNLLAPT